MHVKVRKSNADGLVRLETSGKIAEIRITEDFLRPKKEGIELCFRGEHSSGIVMLSTKEFDEVYQQVQARTKLVKSVKVFKENP